MQWPVQFSFIFNMTVMMQGSATLMQPHHISLILFTSSCVLHLYEQVAFIINSLYISDILSSVRLADFSHPCGAQRAPSSMGCIFASAIIRLQKQLTHFLTLYLRFISGAEDMLTGMDCEQCCRKQCLLQGKSAFYFLHKHQEESVPPADDKLTSPNVCVLPGKVMIVHRCCSFR